ncbi:HEAT repeat domain-containing protein [Embleya sp. NPDC056575]|uniref:HEAT repeat domain-containing protein n=1 Tax=unclassified Embleya TaxID=2699296 RepID=UPI0036C0D2AF
MAGGWPDDSGTLALLRDLATTDTDAGVREAAVGAIAGGWSDDSGTLALLRDLATTDTPAGVREVAVQASTRHHAKDRQQASE